MEETPQLRQKGGEIVYEMLHFIAKLLIDIKLYLGLGFLWIGIIIIIIGIWIIDKLSALAAKEE